MTNAINTGKSKAKKELEVDMVTTISYLCLVHCLLRIQQHFFYVLHRQLLIQSLECLCAQLYALKDLALDVRPF